MQATTKAIETTGTIDAHHRTDSCPRDHPGA